MPRNSTGRSADSSPTGSPSPTMRGCASPTREPLSGASAAHPTVAAAANGSSGCPGRWSGASARLVSGSGAQTLELPFTVGRVDVAEVESAGLAGCPDCDEGDGAGD